MDTGALLGTMPAVPLDRWMGALEPVIGGRSVCDVASLGAHDSAAHDLGRRLSPEAPLPAAAHALLGCGVRPVIKRWATCQGPGGVAAQLGAGARYLDVRVQCEADGGLLAVHSLLGGDVRAEVLLPLAVFLRAPGHAREVVVLDFQHVHGAPLREEAGRARRRALAAAVRRALGPLIVPPLPAGAEAWGAPLAELCDRGTRVFVLLDEGGAGSRAAAAAPPFTRPPGSIWNPWANTPTPDRLREHLERVLWGDRAASGTSGGRGGGPPAFQLRVAQALCTEGTGLIASGLVRDACTGCGLCRPRSCVVDKRSLAAAVRARLLPWVHEWGGTRTPPPPSVLLLDFIQDEPGASGPLAQLWLRGNFAGAPPEQIRAVRALLCAAPVVAEQPATVYAVA
jgi:hypothetical protein